MKLRRVRVYTSKASGKMFFRFDLTAPPQAVDELGWKHGDEISWSVEGGRLILHRSRKSKD